MFADLWLGFSRTMSTNDDFNNFHRDNPIYSRFTDYYKMSRYVVLIASTFSLLGHCTLIMFRSEYGILLGKIFIGFGMSCDGSILGQVGRKNWGYSDSPVIRVYYWGRSFPHSQVSAARRSGAFASCFAFRQLGLISFPAISWLLGAYDWNGQVHLFESRVVIDKYVLPSAFMIGLWTRFKFTSQK